MGNLVPRVKNLVKASTFGFGFKEMIHDGKQNFAEKYAVYYDAILQIDQLEIPIPNMEFLEILKKHLRPEIRREVLHFEITFLARSREFVFRHKLLYKDLNKSKFTKFNVVNDSEIEGHEGNDYMADQIKTLTCWICTRNRRGYEDCLANRRIFCYGYGTQNVL